MEENEISFYIRKAIFKTYNTFGPGLLESVYEKVLKIELEKSGLNVQSQIPLNVVYEGQILDIGFRADLLVENKVIIEIKSVEEISAVHHKQLFEENTSRLCLGVNEEKFEKRMVFHNTMKKCKFD